MSGLYFTHANRKYELLFYHCNIMQITGDSSTGKSLLCSDFLMESKVCPELTNSLMINYLSGNQLEFLKTRHIYDVVIIDNADYILTPEYDDIILRKVQKLEPTLWILMGRGDYGCVVASTARCILRQRKEDDGYIKFYVDYDGESCV